MFLGCCSLKPYSKYTFRLAASNDMGSSGYSAPSTQIVTSPTGIRLIDGNLLRLFWLDVPILTGL